MKILIIDSKTFLTKKLVEHAKSQHIDVVIAESFDDATDAITHAIWDMVLINAQMMGSFCFASKCCNHLSKTGVIIISEKYALQEKLKCYDLGVDMYLVKPLSHLDIINAAERVYSKKRLDRTDAAKQSMVKLNNVTRVLHVDDRFIRLTGKEALLLHTMALAEDAKIETWQLMECLGIIDNLTGNKYLAIIISRLRAKLKANGLNGAIKAIRNYGYQLTVPILLL